MRVGVAADHGGFALKVSLSASLRSAGFEIVDFGAHALNREDDYPDFIVPLAQAVAAGEIERGLALCGSGVGASIAADKVSGVYAGLAHDGFSAHQGVEDDGMNGALFGRKRHRGFTGPGTRRDVPGSAVQRGSSSPAAYRKSQGVGMRPAHRIKRPPPRLCPSFA